MKKEKIYMLLDRTINKYLLYYQLTHKNTPEYLRKDEWNSLISDAVALSSTICNNNDKSNRSKDINMINELNAESFALRDKLFKLLNEHWEEFVL